MNVSSAIGLPPHYYKCHLIGRHFKINFEVKTNSSLCLTVNFNLICHQVSWETSKRETQIKVLLFFIFTFALRRDGRPCPRSFQLNPSTAAFCDSHLKDEGHSSEGFSFIQFERTTLISIYLFFFSGEELQGKITVRKNKKDPRSLFVTFDLRDRKLIYSLQ